MVSFFAELRRRHVFKVGGAYAVVGWLLTQVAAIVLPTFGAPPWVMPVFVTLVILGFPVALVLAWAFEISPEGIRRAARAAEPEHAASRSSVAGYLLVAVLAGSAGAASFWLLSRDVDGQWFAAEALPRIENHLTLGDWETAFSLTQEAQARIGDDPALDELWRRLSWRVSIVSDPPGASVFRRGYDQPETEWKLLGQTPLENIRIPFGLSRLKLELDAHVPLLRTLGGGVLVWNELPEADAFQDLFLVGTRTLRLEVSDTLTADKVRVSGWTETLDGEPVELNDYFLDRYEVTNAEFKRFVDAGGYDMTELWDAVVRDGVVVPWEEAMALFRDRTGRPGPSTWQAGDYPDGWHDHPVTGVSWYEAAAYARFAGQELPTLHHWRRATVGAEIPWVLPASRFDAPAPLRVGESDAISYVGAYDLLGNAREWTATASASDPEQRFILGGGWSDTPDQAAYVLPTVHALDRSETNGFRLAITRDTPAVASRAAAPVTPPAAWQGPSRDPVSREIYDAYGRVFTYEPSPLDASIEETRSTTNWTRQLVSFGAAYGGERMLLYLYLPARGTPPYQTVIHWPGGAATLLRSIDDYSLYLDFVLKSGRAVALPVYAGTFQRGGGRGLSPFESTAYRDGLVAGVKDLRRSIDYLVTRPDLDPDAIAYYGLSWGGFNGATALAQEPRFAAAVIDVGFLTTGPIAPEIDPINALPSVELPVLLMSGERDPTVPIEMARYYFELIGTPADDKRHVVAPGGHFVQRDILIRETLDWLDAHLGPPRHLTSMR